MTPDNRLPAVAPSTERPPQVAIDRLYVAGEAAAARSTAMAAGATRAAPAPWAKRAASSASTPGANGAAAEAAPRTTSPAARAGRPP